MKHSFDPACECARCKREGARRAAQGLAASGRVAIYTNARRYRLIGERSSRRPIVGSQEWAETRGDDLGDSPDF